MKTTAAGPAVREPRGAVPAIDPNTIFLMIFQGYLCRRSTKEIKDPGWIDVETTDKTSGEIKKRWIYPYGALEAWVDNIKWYDRERGGVQYTGWRMTLSAGDKKYILELPFDYGYTMRFMRTAENIDFAVPLEIRVFKDKEDEKTAIAFYQLDEKVPQKYTKADPGDCPQPTKKTVAKKVKWNWDEVMDFFFTQMTDVVIPEVDRCYTERTGLEPGHVREEPAASVGDGGTTEGDHDSAESVTAPGATVTDDDIPF